MAVAAPNANRAAPQNPGTAGQAQQQKAKNSANAKDDIDWNALIEAAVAKKKAPADTIDLKIQQNDLEIAAYKKMQELMKNLGSSLNTIRGTDNTLTRQDDIFSVRQAYLTGKGSVDAKSAVVVTADNGATVRNYDLKILQIATAQKVASRTFSDDVSGLGLKGEFSLKLDGADTATTFKITEGTSLKEIAETINEKSKETGVSASVVKISATEFKLVLNADKTGKNIIMTPASGSNIGQSLGILNASGDYADQLQPARNAIIELDGVKIIRPSNVVDDAVDGVTFSLYKETGEGNSIDVEVAQSLSQINESLKNFVESYNAYRTWALTQQQVLTGGGIPKDAVLFGEGILRNANTSVADALSTVIDKESMALMGFSYDENNLLKIDANTLKDALINDLDAVEKLLNFQSTSTSQDLKLLARNGNMPGQISLDIKVDADGKISSVTADGQEDQFVIKGARIEGVKGSAYEGISFVFTGKEDTKADLTFSSGIAEKLYQSVAKFSDVREGLIQDVVSKLDTENELHRKRHKKIIDDTQLYRSKMVKLYSSYQREIQRAEADLDYLKAILGAKG